MINPFTGKDIQGRKVTRRHHDLHKDRFKDYEFDTERKSDSNEYYELLVHKNEESFLLIKEAEKEYKFDE